MSRFVYKESESTINEWRIKRGIKVAQLVQECNCCLTQYYHLVSGKIAPVYLNGKRSGTIKPWVNDIAVKLNVPVDLLFPVYFCPVSVDDCSIGSDEMASISVSDCTMAMSCNTENVVERREFLKMIDNYIRKVLSDRRRYVTIAYLLNGDTLEKIGTELNLTRERIRQIVKENSHRLRRNLCKFSEFQNHC